MKLHLSNEDIRRLLEILSAEFPTYTSQILNVANQNAQGTRPKVVGQLSELIQPFNGQTFEEWEEWYLKARPEGIAEATERILTMLTKFRDTMAEINRQ